MTKRWRKVPRRAAGGHRREPAAAPGPARDAGAAHDRGAHRAGPRAAGRQV